MKTLRLFVSLAILFIGVTIFSPSASAASRISWGTRDVSYYGDDNLGYHRTLSGATWYYYTIDKRNEYSDDEELYVPFENNYATKTAIPAKTCQGYGGFWVLLRNEYKKTSETTGELTNRPAAAIRLSDVYYSNMTWPATDQISYIGDRTGTPSDTNGNGVSATKYGNMDDVLYLYNKDDLKNTTAVPDTAKTNIGNLSYFCYGPDRPSPANFSSFSTVSLNQGYTSAPVINGNGYLADPIVVPAGSTVSITFKHYLAKGVENALSPDTNINYTLSGDGGGESNTVSTGGLKTYFSIAGDDYYALESPVTSIIENIQVNTTTTYCQTVTFNSSTWNRKQYSLVDYRIVDGGNQLRSSACVTLAPSPSTSKTVSICTQGSDPSVYVSNSVLGNTAATVGLSVNGVLDTTIATGENDRIYAYTRPGDIVQFSYGLCFGAHKARNSVDYYTRKSGQNNPVFNDFAVVIGDGKASESQPEFLFGRNEDILDQTIYVNNVHARTGNFGAKSLFTNFLPSNTLNDVSYVTFVPSMSEILFSSPDDRPKTTSVIHYFADDEGEEMAEDDETEGLWYDCAYYANYNLDTAYDKSTGGYQIPGFQNVAGIDCDSAGLRSMNMDGNIGDRMTSMVGTTLSQSLVYSNVMAWPAYLSNGYSTRGPFYDPSNYQANYSDRFSAGPEYFAQALAAYRSGYTTPVGTNGVIAGPEVTKTASVVTPYNFDTNLSSSITNHDNAIVYPGDVLNISANVDILPRVNPLVKSSNGEPYATITPLNTRVELIELLIPDTVSLDDKFVYADGPENPDGVSLKDILNGNGQIFHKNTICDYFRNYLGDNYGECTKTTIQGSDENLKTDYYPDSSKDVGNNMSNPAGEMEYYHTDDLKRVVPDVEAGYKYCVLIGTNHGDSHSAPGKELSPYPYLDANDNPTDEENSGYYDENGNPIKNKANPLYAANSYSVNNAVDNYVVNSWGLSKASCRTIAKEPNFQVWNGGVYANTINADTIAKAVNTKLTSNLAADDPNPNEEYHATSPSSFGSWAQYFVVAKGDATGFASASALGYTWNKGSLTADGFSQASVEDPQPFGSFCALARLTLANTACSPNTSNGTAGNYAAADADNTFLDSFKDRIMSVYTDERSGVNKDLYSAVDSTDYGDPVSGAEYLKVNGNFTINQPIIQSSGTKVIHVLGHLDISANICLDDGSGICSEAVASNGDWASAYAQNSNNLSLSGRNNLLYNASDITNLPQVIIIAESISISSEVSQIDAWLITNSTSNYYDGGYINTCREFQDSTTGSNTCWKTLKINGPVITTALLLNRTGGAWPGLSGDVGNPAYDNLKEALNAAVNDQSLRESVRVQAENYCNSRFSSSTCIENQIDKLVKTAFLDRIESLYGSAARKAYEYAENYSANSKTVAAGLSYSRDLSCDGSITPAEIFDLHPITYLWAYGQSQKGSQAVITYAQEFSPRY